MKGPYEGESRVYTLRDHPQVEEHFVNALQEESEGDEFQGILSLYKKSNGDIGIDIYVKGDAEFVARTPAGVDAPEYHHYYPENAIGNFGRILAEALAVKAIEPHEQGIGITTKIVALSNSWCTGIYYCK